MPSITKTKLPCEVCGGAAQALRYDAQACRACAAFFRRTVLNGREFKCSHGGGCDLSIASRCVCRACRYEGCLKAGMKKKRVFEAADAVADIPQDPEHCLPASTFIVPSLPPAMNPARNESSPQEALAMRMPVLDQLVRGYSRLMEKRATYTPRGIPNRVHPYEITLDHKHAIVDIDFLNYFDFLLRFFPKITGLNETLKVHILKKSYPYLSSFNKSSITARLTPTKTDRFVMFDGNYINTTKVGEFMSNGGTIMSEEDAEQVYKPVFDIHEQSLTAPLRKMQMSGVEEVALIGLIIADVVLNELAGHADDMALDVQKEIYRELYEFYSSFMENNEDKAARVSTITSLMPALEHLVLLQRENDVIATTYAFVAGKEKKKSVGCGA